MSLVIRLLTPAGGDYDLMLPANIAFGALVGDDLMLEQRVEEKLTRFSVGDLALTCIDEFGWWGTTFAGANRLARYPDTFVIKVERDGVVRWEGDIDLTTVSYDRIRREVSFTVIGKAGRLKKYSAETVRRSCPELSDWGTSTSIQTALTLASGENTAGQIVLAPVSGYAYVCCITSPARIVKVRMSDLSRVGVLTLETGENSVQAAVIDEAEEYLYAFTYTSPAKVVKIRLSDFTRVSALDLATGENNVTCAMYDATTGHAYAGTYTAPGIVVKVNCAGMTRIAALTLDAGENYLYSGALDTAAGNGYFSAFVGTGIMVKVNLAAMTRTAALTFSAGEGYPRGTAIDVAGGYVYAACWLSATKIVKVQLSDFTRTGVITLSSGENEATEAVISGAYLFVTTNLSPGKVIRVSLATFLRVDVVTLASGENTPFTMASDGTSLYVVTSTSASRVVKLHEATMTRVTTLFETGKAWTENQFLNHALIDSVCTAHSYVSHAYATDVVTLYTTHGWAADTRVVLTGGTFGGLTQGATYYVQSPSAATLKLSLTIGGAAIDLSSTAATGTPVIVPQALHIVGNSATGLSVVGTPIAGTYTIRPSAWITYVSPEALPRKMTSMGASIAELGLQVGDKLVITRTGGAPSRLVYPTHWKATHLYYLGTYEASQQTVAVKHVGPSTYPLLTDHEIGVDTDLTADMDPGDHVVNATPYYRDKTVAQLVALLYQAAELTASEYAIDVPTLTENVVTYADFSGKTVGDELAELARLVTCVVAAPHAAYIFQRRETALALAGTCGSLDLLATLHAGQDIGKESYDYVLASGANDTSVKRGLVEYLANGAEISSDWVTTYPWLKQICDRMVAVLLGTRRSCDMTILDGREVNLVVDPSFEGRLAINAAGSAWVNGGTPGAGESYAKSTERASHLRQSLKIVAAGSAAGLGSKQLLSGWTAGQQVRLSVAVSRGAGAGRLYVDLYGKDAGSAVVLDTSGISFLSDTAGEFVRKREVVTIPATCTQLWLRIFAGAGSFWTAYVDEASVELVGVKVDPQLLAQCTVGSDQYLMMAVRESVLSSLYPSVVELELSGTDVTALDSAYDTTSDEATPPQLIVESISVTNYSTDVPVFTTYQALLSWPYPTAPIAKVLYTTWNIVSDRPDAITASFAPVMSDADSLQVEFTISAIVTADQKYADFTILYADGRMSQPSAPATLPPST